MTLPAARHGDPAACSHGSTSLDASTTILVEVNGRNAAKIGSLAGCAATGSTVISGSSTVLINGSPAARATDTTTDGIVVIGSFDVLIGGPTAGLAGAVGAQKDACQAAAGTRSSGSTAQSYGNCGLETWRNLINKERAAKGLPPMTEDQLLDEQQKSGRAANAPGAHNNGAISPANQAAMLEEKGIPAETRPQSIEEIEKAVREGKGVGVSVHPYWWGDYVKPNPDDAASWLHAIAVTGVEYDEHGNVAAFIVNDTGLGQCGLRIPVDEFDKALEKRIKMTVTKRKVW